MPEYPRRPANRCLSRQTQMDRLRVGANQGARYRLARSLEAGPYSTLLVAEGESAELAFGG